jgi:hypothetical protein
MTMPGEDTRDRHRQHGWIQDPRREFTCRPEPDRGGRKNYVPVSLAWLAPESLKAPHPGRNELVVELSAPAGALGQEKSRFIDVGLFEPGPGGMKDFGP